MRWDAALSFFAEATVLFTAFAFCLPLHMRCNPEVYVMSDHVNAWITAPVKGAATLNTFIGLSELLTGWWKPFKINRDCILELQNLMRTFQSEATEAVSSTESGYLRSQAAGSSEVDAAAFNAAMNACVGSLWACCLFWLFCASIFQHSNKVYAEWLTSSDFYSILCCRLLPSKGCRPKVGWSLSMPM